MKAFVFPGQGSQYSGMGKSLARAFPEARRVFEEADEVLEFPLSRLCFGGPSKELVLTENTQPALLTTSVAVCRVLERAGHRPDYVAGHSLGEYTALVVAGSLTFADAVRLVWLRGRFMQEAVPVGAGAMAAVLGLSLATVEEICRESARGEIVAPANLNSPEQIVIAGNRQAVERACESARRRGAKRVIPLAVSAPFHCELMRPAEERLAEVLKGVPFRDLECPLVNNVEAALVRKGEDAREGLIRQVCAPVRWTQCVTRLRQEGVRSFLEVGPGRVLAGLIRRIAPEAETLNLETPEQLTACLGV